jgi:hypothetical protein
MSKRLRSRSNFKKIDNIVVEDRIAEAAVILIPSGSIRQGKS